MDTETKRDVMPRVSAVNQELIRTIDHFIVTIARDIPHDHLIAFFDLLAAELKITRGCSTHVGKRRLPTNNFRNHPRN